VDAVRNADVEAEKEIIVIDDCSKDGTRDILRADIAPLVAKILYHEVNKGKGALTPLSVTQRLVTLSSSA
jgi:glycosyltransferase involved in cell wall biosynthesis